MNAVPVPARRSLLALFVLLWFWVFAHGADADAAAVKAAIKKDVLTVTGTPTADAITLRLDPGDPNKLVVDVGSDGTADFTFDRTKFSSITVDGLGGPDVLVLDRTYGTFTGTEITTLNGGDGADILLGEIGDERLNGGAGDDFVDGNQGADTVSLGDGNDVVQWDPGDGSDTIAGGTGSDRLQFNGSNASENFDLAAVAGGHARLTRDIAAIVLDLDDLEIVDLRTSGGTDAVTANNLSGTDVAEVRIDLAAFGGGDDGAVDTVTVNGTAADDSIAVTATGATVVTSGLTAPVKVSGAAPGADRLTVNGLAGNDTLTATPEAQALIVVTLVQ